MPRDLLRAVVALVLALVQGIAFAGLDVPEPVAASSPWSIANQYRASTGQSSVQLYYSSFWLPQAEAGASWKDHGVVACKVSGITYPTATETSVNGRWTVSNSGATYVYSGVTITAQCSASGTFGVTAYPLGLSCPPNSTGPTSACVCDIGYRADGLACVQKTCTAGSLGSAGYYDVGLAPGNSPQINTCINGCSANFDGTSPAGSALVNGKKLYYAAGAYILGGSTCSTPVDPGVDGGNGSTDVPPSTCPEGQAMGQVNGSAVCAGGSDTNVIESEKTTTKGETTTTTNANGTTTTTGSVTTTASDGSTTTTTTTTVRDASGKVISVNTKESTTPGSSGGTNSGSGPAGGSGAGTSTDPAGDKGPCELNSSASGCGGPAAGVQNLYTKGAGTWSDTIDQGLSGIQSSPLGAAMTGFFTVSSSAACPSWSAQIPYLDVQLSFDMFCGSWALGIYLALRSCLLLVGAFLAFRIAIY